MAIYAWLVVVILTWFGLGSLLWDSCGLGSRYSSVGLRVGLGFSVILVLGGLHLALGLPSGAVFVAEAIVGVSRCLWLAGCWCRAPFDKHSLIQRLPFISLLVVCAVAVALSVVDRRFSCYDDYLAYFAHARMILERGSLVDPFSFRRLASFGGQAYQHAFILLGSRFEALASLDHGLALVAVAILFYEELMKSSKSWLLPLGFSLLFLFMDVPRINTASQITGLLCFSTFVSLLRRLVVEEDESRWIWIALAVVGAAFSTLRANFGPGAEMLLALSWIGYPKARTSLLKASISIFILLLPWMLEMYVSSGTPWFPILKGNYVSSVSTLNYIPSRDRIVALTLQLLSGSNLEFVLPLGLLGWVVFRDKLSIQVLVVALFMLLLMHFSTLSADDPGHAFRYSFPFLFGSMFYSVVAISRQAEVGRVARILKRAALPFLCLTCWSSVWQLQSLYLLGSFKDAADLRFLKNDAFAKDREGVQLAQSGVEPGHRMLVAIDQPFLLDFKRNPIWSLDVPGQAGPPLALEWGDSRAVLEAWKKLGIEDFVFEAPESSTCQYSSKFWQRIAVQAHPIPHHSNWLAIHLGYFGFLETLIPFAVHSEDGKYYHLRIR